MLIHIFKSSFYFRIENASFIEILRGSFSPSFKKKFLLVFFFLLIKGGGRKKATRYSRDMGFEPWISRVSEALNEPRDAIRPHVGGQKFPLVDDMF